MPAVAKAASDVADELTITRQAVRPVSLTVNPKAPSAPVTAALIGRQFRSTPARISRSRTLRPREPKPLTVMLPPTLTVAPATTLAGSGDRRRVVRA